MDNRLNRDYGLFSLFRYTIPSILSLLFMALYQMVDAIFVANILGENSLAALNIVYPLISIILAVIMMMTSGGTAIVAKKMGEKKIDEARRDFTLITIVTSLITILLSLLGLLFIEPLFSILGVTKSLHHDSHVYITAILPFMPLAALQLVFSSYLVVAGKPGLGFMLTALSGIINILFDYIFMAVLQMGIRGSALGTVLGYFSSALPGLMYFTFCKKEILHFSKPIWNSKMIGFVCYNGMSEMISNLSVSVTTILFNLMALQYVGESGVAAITIALYSQFTLTSVYMGFIQGAAPLFSYNLGSKNTERLRKLFKNSISLVCIITVLVVIISFLFAKPIVSVFIKPASDSFNLALRGFRIFSFSYLFAGFNIFTSGLFTALHNGKTSAVLSILRTFVFLVISLLGLPMLIGTDGIFGAVPIAEMASFFTGLGLIAYSGKKYFLW